MKTRRARSVIGVLTAGGLLVGLTGGASGVWAQVMPSASLQQISGKVLLVDPAKNLLKVEAEPQGGSASKAQAMEFALTSDTTITEGARKLQATELRMGAKVQVGYRVEGSKNIAQLISVQKPAQAGESTTPEGTHAPSPQRESPQPPSPSSRPGGQQF